MGGGAGGRNEPGLVKAARHERPLRAGEQAAAPATVAHGRGRGRLGGPPCPETYPTAHTQASSRRAAKNATHRVELEAGVQRYVFIRGKLVGRLSHARHKAALVGAREGRRLRVPHADDLVCWQTHGWRARGGGNAPAVKGAQGGRGAGGDQGSGQHGQGWDEARAEAGQSLTALVAGIQEAWACLPAASLRFNQARTRARDAPDSRSATCRRLWRSTRASWCSCSHSCPPR